MNKPSGVLPIAIGVLLIVFNKKWAKEERRYQAKWLGWKTKEDARDPLRWVAVAMGAAFVAFGLLMES